MKSLQLQK